MIEKERLTRLKEETAVYTHSLIPDSQKKLDEAKLENNLSENASQTNMERLTVSFFNRVVAIGS